MGRSLKFERKDFARAADGLTVALVASLPWSTSATSILAVLLLVALLPTLDMTSMWRVLATPAGGLPTLLVVLGVVGMLWAGVPWADRFNGATPYLKLLFIPLLLHHFSRSGRGDHVLLGFLASCIVLMIVSWMLLQWPTMPWPVAIKAFGVPVKDYISQGAMFTICLFAIMRFVVDAWRDGRRGPAVALGALALLFLANVFYVATSRTSLVVIPILMFVFGYRQARWKGGIGLVTACLLLAAAAWPSASFLRTRVTTLTAEVQTYESNTSANTSVNPGANTSANVSTDAVPNPSTNAAPPPAAPTSAGLRLEFWQQSLNFIRTAPVFGHGTGTIGAQFRTAAEARAGLTASTNPHNQIFATGIQLGLVGILLLLAMWLAHLMLFRSHSFAALVGLIVVIQNVISCLFNSHLFDFTQGWAYVIGVGIAGGVVMKELAVTKPTLAATSSANPVR
jgi:O-antigen ligase